MLNAQATFQVSLAEARNSTVLYEFLTTSIISPFPYDDLLRSQLVYAVSAFDKLIHDLIRIGMVEMYVGKRPRTAKYHCEQISLELHAQLSVSTLPPPELVFEQEIARKLKYLSFQDPTKVADGLAYIWEQNDKWRYIAMKLGLIAEQARTTLKLIGDRRNAIVHESDMIPLINLKNPITLQSCNDATDFLDRCGNAIVELVL